MPPLARKPQQIYINRDIDFIIEDHIEEKTSKLLFLHGQGGVGKSTLLKNFFSYDTKEVPTVLINLQDKNINSFVDILLDEDITSVKHCPNFEKIRTILLKEPKLLNAIIKSDTEVVESQLEEYDKEWGEYAKIAIDGLKFGAKFLKSGEEKKKKEFLKNPEFVLLSALTEDFEEYGLFMVDTFEKIKSNDIKSKINFTDSGELSMRLKEKHYRLKDYIEGLIYLLVENSTFIIAGRNSQDELNMEVPLNYTDELSLENFSISNIKELFSRHVKIDKKLSMPSDKHIEHIAELSNGNPLLVKLFPKVAKEYDSWDELNYKEMERRIKTDDEFGLLFYMTDRVLTHLEESTEVWKLVIPRVLNTEVEKLLFKDEKILKELIEVGLATKGTGKDSERYYLHDDVHRAIVAYYERKFKGGFSSWYNAKNVAKLHGELMEFYKTHIELHGVNSAFEECYHNIMLMNDCEERFSIKRVKLSEFYLSSIGLSSQDKIEYCQNIKTWINKEIIEALNKDNKSYKKYMSEELFQEITKALLKGTIKTRYDINFLKKLKNNGFHKDASLYFHLGSSEYKQKNYHEALNFYNESLQHINGQDNKYSSYIYNNIGLLYADQNNDKEALIFYKKALEIGEDKLNVYINLITTYDKLNEFDKSINSYEKALELNPQNSSIYINMSENYRIKKLYKKSIKVYIDAIKTISKNTEIYRRLYLVYMNYFQYELIKNQQFDQTLEKKYIELYQRESFIHYEMLKILQDISHKKELNVEQWKQKYTGVSLSGWSFDELDGWINEIENTVLKAKLQEALEVFKEHG